MTNKLLFIIKRRKPRLAWKLAKLNANICLRKQYPLFRQVEIQNTFECNLRCIYCSAGSFKQVQNPLTLADYAAIAEQCKQHDVPMVSFTGGEPLCDDFRLDRIIRLFDTRSTLISITSNGTLVTPEIALRLNIAGVDSFVISLDGDTADINDKYRGAGTYDQIMRGEKIARAYGFFTMFIHTVTHESIQTGTFDDLVRFTKTRNMPLHVSLYCSTGYAANDAQEKRYTLTGIDVSYLWQIQGKHKHVRRDLNGNYRGIGCPAGRERFVITPTGDCLSCTKIQASFGNIKDEPMAVIADRMGRYMDKFKNKCNPICLPAEHPDFLRIYLPRLYGNKNMPVDYEKYFE